MNAFVTISRLAAAPFSEGITGRRTQRAVLLIGLLLAIATLALTASFATSASAQPDGPPIIVNDEPTPDVHDPPINDEITAPSPAPTAEPIDDKAPLPPSDPDPDPDPIDDVITSAPDDDDPNDPNDSGDESGDEPGDEQGSLVVTNLPDTGAGSTGGHISFMTEAAIAALILFAAALIGVRQSQGAMSTRPIRR